MNRRAFYHLLQRYSDGTCTEEEKQLVEQWYELLDDDHEAAVSNEEAKTIVDRLWPVIKEKTLPQPEPVIIDRPVRRMPAFLRWTAAAAAMAAIAFGLYWVIAPGSSESSETVAYLTNRLSRTINNGNTPDTVYLPDKSRVILEPKATLYYPDSFELAKREVYLEGNAFFEVTKNPNAPFYVYSNNIVTQVLGTSFFVKTDALTNDVEVSVRTGKVAVYEKETPKGSKQRQQESTGVILKPNQKVIYNRIDGHFRTMLVDVPLPLMLAGKQEETITELNFVFEEMPLSKVLARLEEAYHIEIITENETLEKALFSGDIKGQNLYDQLEIICQAVQATYEVRGTRILVKGESENQ
ncbi:FecR family protein [Paraflavitalea sp. CAU 1676]|uniref:FecR family protein n=1 Tax=Paraflavitalea sp. CAU 1676 TaxID=3032598 RepID=UPI0023DB58DF|nr:FecR family protein [Paraflavitalea sp. CAU 1676]MDF2187600.1 FecR family protein [Paraflavitalea sp. CAU 1676]